MAHGCPDGIITKLVRTGPVGTAVRVTFHCPRCGYCQSAAVIHRNVRRVLRDPEVRASLAR